MARHLEQERGRRDRALVLAQILALIAACGSAQAADDFPARPVRFLVPFPPGGALDTLARLTGQKLTESWNRQVVVENRPGASGIIGTELAAKAAPDGYTYVIVTVPHAVNPSLYSKLPYDSVRDFTAVGTVAAVPSVLVVHPSLPVTSVRELISLAQKRPGEILYASSGAATTSHVSVVLFASMAKINLVHVPYKGAAPAVADLVGGQTQVMIDPIISSGPYVKQNRLRALAVTPDKRTALLPELPTIAEAGLPGYEFKAWFGFLAPAKTPPDIIARMNKEIVRVLALADIKVRLANLGAEPLPLSPAEFSDLLSKETARWGKVVREANVRVE